MHVDERRARDEVQVIVRDVAEPRHVHVSIDLNVFRNARRTSGEKKCDFETISDRPVEFLLYRRTDTRYGPTRLLYLLFVN